MATGSRAAQVTRILALAKYGRQAASTRQRILQYIPALQEAGFSVSVESLLGDDYVANLATRAGYSRAAVARSFLRRLTRLLARPDYDMLWVYAEAVPYLPLEGLVKHGGKPFVYDFDDAFFHQYANHRNPLVRRLLGRKLEPLMRTAAVCCCGNAYLQNHAVKFCRDSIVLPTVVDTDNYVPAGMADPSEVPVIGWIGSPSTWANMRPLLPLLAELCGSGRARMRVIGAGRGAEQDWFPGMELIAWTEAGEVDEVQRMTIGIMPLNDLPFQRGKSGYKLIQYMACGLPVVASPVGVNESIVMPETGFLARSIVEWRTALELLLATADLRRVMGAAGRLRAVSEYSLASQAPRLIAAMRRAEASR